MTKKPITITLYPRQADLIRILVARALEDCSSIDAAHLRNIIKSMGDK